MLTHPGLIALRRRAEARRRPFVRAIAVRDPLGRSRWAERLLAAGWAAIAVKCGLVTWAIHHWSVPFDPAWVNLPTLMMAALVTFIYLRRNGG